MTRPGMSDGRCFTSYMPNCELNTQIKSLNKIDNNSEYRSFLQQNADQFMKQMQSTCKHSEQFYCSLCNHTFKK